MNAIETLKAAVKSSNAAQLERNVYSDQKIGLLYFQDEKERKDSFIDVPVSAMVALIRFDFCEEARTWREALDGVHGDGWKHDIFQYFSSDLYDNPFMQENSAYGLRMQCVGGACNVTNGVHRAVAGREWLISQNGDAAVFHKVNTIIFALPTYVKDLLVDALKRDLTVHIANARGHNGANRYVHLWNGNTQEQWAWTDTGVKCVDKPGKLKAWYRKNTGKVLDPEFQWKPVPRDVIEAMLDDAWIVAQTPV